MFLKQSAPSTSSTSPEVPNLVAIRSQAMGYNSVFVARSMLPNQSYNYFPSRGNTPKRSGGDDALEGFVCLLCGPVEEFFLVVGQEDIVWGS